MKYEGYPYEYDVNEYVPIENGFQICFENRRMQNQFIYKWQPKVYDVRKYLSFTGTFFNSLGYVASIILFTKYTRKVNASEIYLQLFILLLIISDVIFVVSNLVSKGTSLCKWVGLTFHWSLLLVNVWSSVTAIDLALQLTN